MRIAFLGNYQIKKGSEVFARLVTKMTKMGTENLFYILGPIGDEKSWQKIKTKIVKQYPYDNADLAQIFQREEIDLVIVPSIWPETFMMTFFQAAQSQMPIIAPKLGFPYYFLRDENYPLFFKNEAELENLIISLTEEKLTLAKNILAKKMDGDFWKKTEVQFDLLGNMLE